MARGPTGPEIISRLSDETFYHKVECGVGQTVEFGAMLSSSAGRVRPEYKATLRTEFTRLGIAPEQMATDEQLAEIVQVIYHRALELTKPAP